MAKLYDVINTFCGSVTLIYAIHGYVFVLHKHNMLQTSISIKYRST